MQENKTRKWRRVLVNVSVSLLTSRSISNVINTIAPLGVFLGCIKTPKKHNVFSNLKQVSHAESTGKTRRLVLKVYNIKVIE